MLRALGYEAGAVRPAFMVESAFVTLEDIVVGTTLALVTAWRIVTNDTFASSASTFRGRRWGAGGGHLRGSILAMATPARQAARIPPAAALRLTD